LHNAHNHPSGNVRPSESDITITRKIKESGIVMDIQLLDHLIVVPEGNYYSMGDEGIVKINSNNMCNFNMKKDR